MSSTRFPAGWGKPLLSRKFHYFPDGSMDSICGRWGFFGGDREDDMDEHVQNCVTCMRAVKKLRTKEAAK